MLDMLPERYVIELECRTMLIWRHVRDVHVCMWSLQLPSCSECNISSAVQRLSESNSVLFQSHRRVWSWQPAISCCRCDSI